MKIVTIVRDKFFENETLGKCYVRHNTSKQGIEYIGESLERAWKDNKQRFSCIPIGTYRLKYEYSNKFKKHLWELKDVKGRRECKFHAANFWKQLNGCIALGRNRKDINADGIPDITSSRLTMKKFHEALAGEKSAILIVVNL